MLQEQSRLQAQFQLGVESRMKVVDELRQFVQDQDDLSIDLSLPQSSLVDWLRENLDILKRATSKTNKQHSLIQEENYELKREIDQKQIKMTEAITKLVVDVRYEHSLCKLT